ncbi:MAG TPA: DUF885 family protein, partial [Micromonosporaceae bacterium]|nr:DUF885 family protein [Micromonosporaceae bacterium]
MGRIDDLANRYVAEWAALNPIGATYVGIAGYDDQLGDLSPAGFAAQAELNRTTLAEAERAEPVDERELVAKEAMVERLALSLARYDAGEAASELNVISSSLHGVRQVFDLMPTEGEEAVANISARLGRVPAALDDVRRTLTESADAGHVSARQQIIEVAKQCDVWTDPAGDDFFHRLAGRLDDGGDAALRSDLERHAGAATAAVAAFARFLRDELAP